VLLSCILLTIAVIGGALLTFLYEGPSTLALRLCIGACTGLALAATFGFLLSHRLGLTLQCDAFAFGLLLLPVLLLLRRSIRRRLQEEVRSALKQLRDVTVLGSIVFYVALAVVLGLAFGQNMVERPSGIYTADPNNLGDLPFHLHVVSSLAYGGNIPVSDPNFAGVRLTYPVLADFLTAMLVRAGAPMAAAMWLQNMVLVLAFAGLLHHWTRALTGDRLAALLTPLLVVFSGGLGWWLLMQDLRQSDGGLITLLGNLPRDYTIENSSIFRWGNSFTTLLLPERSFLFGLPLAVLVFYQWWAAIRVANGEGAQEGGKISAITHMLAAGICAGLLPLIHTHGFVVALGTGACLALVFRSLWRGWLIFFISGLLTGLPAMLWLSHGSAVDSSKFIAWQPGWDHAGYDPVWFWFVNTGFFIPLLLAAIFWRRSRYAAPRSVALFCAPFLIWFVVPNLLKLSPWIWDNIKFLFYWYVGSAPLVAFFLARLWRERSQQRWLAAGLAVTLTLAGALDVLRVITHATELEEFTRDGIQMARLINLVAPPRALLLHAPDWSSPAYLTGTRSLAGYTGWLWSRGLDSSRRETDIYRIYAGGPLAESLMKEYHVDYVLIGPTEVERGANRAFWAGCSRLANIGQYQLYKADCDK
jgi:hypothetical protein